MCIAIINLNIVLELKQKLLLMKESLQESGFPVSRFPLFKWYIDWNGTLEQSLTPSSRSAFQRIFSAKMFLIKILGLQ